MHVVRLLILVVVVFFLVLSCQENADPPLKMVDLPNENKFASTESCKGCHQEIYESYALTGKGRAFGPMENDTFSPINGQVVFDTINNLYYKIDKEKSGVFITEFRLAGEDSTHYRKEQVSYFIGSGNKTRSYLRSINGYQYEMPVTYYTEKQLWALSPGYEKNNLRFDRPVADECLFCHVSDVEVYPESFNRFSTIGGSLIGCEKCHGPAAKHVAAKELGMEENYLVSLSELTPQRSFDVCQQCHLEGIGVKLTQGGVEDYRPGDLLSDYLDVYLPHEPEKEEFGFASHAERLQLADCFQKSDQKLQCTSCHPPHEPTPKDYVAWYNQQCQSCHGKQVHSCALSIEERPNNYCAGCHMPEKGTTDIPHVFSHDHNIRIVEEQGKKQEINKADEGIVLTSFLSTENPHLAQAYIEYFEKVDQNPRYLAEVKGFLGQLKQGSKLKYHYLSGEPAEISLLSQAPNRYETTAELFYVGALRARQGLDPEAYFNKLLEIAPYRLEFLNSIAAHYLDDNELDKAAYLYTKIIELDSTWTNALVDLGYVYLQKGNPELSVAYLEKAIALRPDYFLAKENLVLAKGQLGKYKEAIEILRDLSESNPKKKSQYIDLIDQLKHLN